MKRLTGEETTRTTRVNWGEAWQKIGPEEVKDKADPGFLTTEELAKMWGISESHARNTIIKLEREGKVECQRARAPGHVHPVKHWRPKV